MTPEQADAVEEFKALRGVEPFGPFVDLLVSPELMNRVSSLGEYLRFRSALPPRLSELAILVTAAHWHQLFEWEVHAPIALAAGLSQETIDALWARIPPPHLEADEQVVYDLCTALHKDQQRRPKPPRALPRGHWRAGHHGYDCDLRLLRAPGDDPEFQAPSPQFLIPTP